MIQVERREHRRGRHRVIHEAARDELPIGVVDEMLAERAADPLRDRAVHLPFDDHRIDDATGVLHADPATDADDAGRRIDLDDRSLRAGGERAANRIVKARRLETGLDVRRQSVRFEIGHARHLGERDRAAGRAAHAERAVGDLEIFGRRLEQVRGDASRLVAHRPRRQRDRAAADHRLTRGEGTETERRGVGVAQDDRHR